MSDQKSKSRVCMCVKGLVLDINAALDFNELVNNGN